MQYHTYNKHITVGLTASNDIFITVISYPCIFIKNTLILHKIQPNVCFSNDHIIYTNKNMFREQLQRF